MKKLIIVVGALVGGLLFRHLLGHSAGAFIGVALGCLIAYFLLNFPRYLRADPKRLLAFHKNNDFSIMFTTPELKSLLTRLSSGGFLKSMDIGDFSCSVDATIWRLLSREEKEAFCRLCHEVCRRDTGIDFVSDLNIYAYDEQLLSNECNHIAHFLQGKGLTK